MSDRDRVIKCVKKIKGDYFTIEENLVSDGWIDSFELLRLISELENEFEIKIQVQRISPESLDSIDDIISVIGKIDLSDNHGES